jgi:hypothetical protein
VSTRHSKLRSAALTGLLIVGAAASASADTFRQAVVVDRPEGLSRRNAELAIEGSARIALTQAFVSTRLSPDLLTLRGEETRIALEPVADLVRGFRIVTSQQVNETQVRVICEAEVDTALLALRLVTGGVLTFGREAPPRVLLVPAPGTRIDVANALRVRLASTLGDAGIVLTTASIASSGGRGGAALASFGGDALMAQAAAARADFVGILNIATETVPSPVGGTVLDGAIQYTLLRPRDVAIVGEEAFRGRSSGASALLATNRLLDDLSPDVARSLGGQIVEAIFADGHVLSPDARPGRQFHVQVFHRASPEATPQLMALLRERGFDVSLGTSFAPPVSMQISDADFHRANPTPLDHFIVEGPDSIETLYDVLSAATFGSPQLRVTVFQYAHDYAGISIHALASTIVPFERKPELPVEGDPISSAAPVVRAAVNELRTGGNDGDARTSAGGAGQRTAPDLQAVVSTRPLQFRFRLRQTFEENAGR